MKLFNAARPPNLPVSLNFIHICTVLGSDIHVFGDVTRRHPLNSYRRFGETCSYSLHGLAAQELGFCTQE